MTADYPKQGEIWWASFQEGWERPALGVSRNELNRGLLVLVVPCTSSQVEERAVYSNHVLLIQRVRLKFFPYLTHYAHVYDNASAMAIGGISEGSAQQRHF